MSFEIAQISDRIEPFGLCALALNKLTQQANCDELETCHHHEHAKEEQGTIADRPSVEQPKH